MHRRQWPLRKWKSSGRYCLTAHVLIGKYERGPGHSVSVGMPSNMLAGAVMRVCLAPDGRLGTVCAGRLSDVVVGPQLHR